MPCELTSRTCATCSPPFPSCAMTAPGWLMTVRPPPRCSSWRRAMMAAARLLSCIHSPLTTDSRHLVRRAQAWSYSWAPGGSLRREPGHLALPQKEAGVLRSRNLGDRRVGCLWEQTHASVPRYIESTVSAARCQLTRMSTNACGTGALLAAPGESLFGLFGGRS